MRVGSRRATPSSIASSTPHTGSISPAIACDAHEPAEHQGLTAAPPNAKKLSASEAPDPRAASCRNPGRHHLGMPGRLHRNPHSYDPTDPMLGRLVVLGIVGSARAVRRWACWRPVSFRVPGRREVQLTANFESGAAHRVPSQPRHITHDQGAGASPRWLWAPTSSFEPGPVLRHRAWSETT